MVVRRPVGKLLQRFIERLTYPQSEHLWPLEPNASRLGRASCEALQADGLLAKAKGTHGGRPDGDCWVRGKCLGF